MSLTVVDRLDIIDIVTRADQAASDRDADAYVQLFTEDAVLDDAKGRHVGREALRAAVGPVWDAEGPATWHLTLNPVVTALDSGNRPQATVRSMLLIVDPASPFTVRTATAISQVLTRRNGTWYISRRTVVRRPGQTADEEGDRVPVGQVPRGPAPPEVVRVPANVYR